MTEPNIATSHSTSTLWRSIAMPLVIAFGLPTLALLLTVLLARYSPDRLIIVGALPLLSWLGAWVYFCWATRSRRFFARFNTLKSIGIALVAFELYRQLLISLAKLSGTPTSDRTQIACTSAVEAFGAAAACATSAFGLFLVQSVLLWVVPAIALALFARHRPKARASSEA